MKHDHKLTYIDLRPQSITPRKTTFSDVCAALIFAGLIALPFALYFAFVMKP